MVAEFPKQQPGVNYLAEGGQETEIMYKYGFELPSFAMFPLLDNPRAVAELRGMYGRYLDTAARHAFGVVIGGLDYRASPDWAARQLATIALRSSRSERRFSTDQDAHGATTLAITADSTLDPRTSAAISTAQSWQVGPTQPDPVTQVPHDLLARCRFSRLPGQCRYESRKSAST